jgi:hypothetical protein
MNARRLTLERWEQATCRAQQRFSRPLEAEPKADPALTFRSDN